MFAQLGAGAVAVVPQVSALVAGLSALDNVALGLRARGESASGARTRRSRRSACTSWPSAPRAA